MLSCKICAGEFSKSPDQVVLCSHHGQSVHFGCCVSRCSGEGKPCVHSQGIYKKI